MTEKRVFFASEGPFIYDDTEDLNEYEGVFAGRKQAAITTDGEILLIQGAGLTLEGAADYGGGSVTLKGTSRVTQLQTNSDGTSVYLMPEEPNVVTLYIGFVPVAGTPSWGDFSSVRVTVGDASDDNTYYFNPLDFNPGANKGADCGTASIAWDDVYADDFQNVADFFYLDDRDDLAALDQIKGSGIIDPRTGLEIIDDDTLPEWMKSKCKNTKEILTDPDGKPFISLKVVSSLLMGACRQLNQKIAALDAIVKKLQQEKANA
jgi:hypothetical protein